MNRAKSIILISGTAALVFTACASNQSKRFANAAVSTPAATGQNSNSPPSKSDRTYTREVAGQAPVGAPGGSFFTLISSDGMKFTKWSTDYETPERANAHLQRKLSKALEIVSREPTEDASGRRVGETVVARFAATNHDAGPASLLWTAGSELFQVDSSSIQNILQYRKDFNH